MSVQSSSHQEERMIKYIKSFVLKEIPTANVEVINKNVYVTKGTLTGDESYPCVVAHTDTVHTMRTNFTVHKSGDTMFAFSEDTHSQVGIGGDDKSGIWIALEMLLRKDTIKGVFFWGEEIGCIGSSDANQDFFDDVGYCLQCDRRGNSDFVTSIYSERMVSNEFMEICEPIIHSYGYGEADGMTTDVYKLKEDIDVSMVNMSCGYYSPHSDDEVISITDTFKCMSMVSDLINELGLSKYKHKLEYSTYNYNTYNALGWSKNTKDYKSDSCMFCYSETLVKYNDIEFCSYCDIDWGYSSIDKVDVFCPDCSGYMGEPNHYIKREAGLENKYFCLNCNVFHRWDEVVVYNDDDVILLRKKHTNSEEFVDIYVDDLE